MCKVIHITHKTGVNEVYIGRPSKWGNPFTHLKSSTLAEYRVNTRKEAISAYRAWITNGAGMHLLKDLHELEGKTLVCWCKPQSCHGDVLLELVNNYSQSKT